MSVATFDDALALLRRMPGNKTVSHRAWRIAHVVLEREYNTALSPSVRIPYTFIPGFSPRDTEMFFASLVAILLLVRSRAATRLVECVVIANGRDAALAICRRVDLCLRDAIEYGVNGESIDYSLDRVIRAKRFRLEVLEAFTSPLDFTEHDDVICIDTPSVQLPCIHHETLSGATRKRRYS